jgi:hypothetical protein
MVCGKVGRYRRRALAHLAELLEGHKRVPYKDCNKSLASRLSAHMENHPAAVGHNAQPDFPE